MIMTDTFTTPAPNYTVAEWDALPQWERELLTPTPVPAQTPRWVREWAITEGNFDGGRDKIIFRHPQRLAVETEYDDKGYPLDASLSFGEIGYWADEPGEWDYIGPIYF